MNSEIHLFIIWEKGREKEEQILSDIFARFCVLGLYKIKWPKENFSKNITRFYGQNLPSSSQKIKHCGDGEFILVVIKDEHPTYKYRKTTKGVQKVNINIFDAKELYRYWTGGGHKIHGTNSIFEVNHDLTLLLGINAKDYAKLKEFTKQPTSINEAEILSKELMGANGWNSLEQLLYVMNNCMNYIILRNYESFPENIIFGEHGDVDLLGESEKQMQLVLNSVKVFDKPYRVRHKAKVGNDCVFFDLRYIGDGYYDKSWENKMLQNRILCNNLFYVPNNEDYAYSLLYHGLVHKGMISSDYIERLKKYPDFVSLYKNDVFNVESAILKLKKYMKMNNYIFTEPMDYSVYYNSINIGIAESISHRIGRGTYTIKTRLRRKLPL